MTFPRLPWFLLCFAIGLSGLIARADDRAAPDKDRIYEASEVERLPKPKSAINPLHPFDLYQQKIEGEVVVGCVVHADGSVSDMVAKPATIKNEAAIKAPLTKAEAGRQFEAAAMYALYKCKFRPGRIGKQDVNVRMEITIPFVLKR